MTKYNIKKLAGIGAATIGFGKGAVCGAIVGGITYLGSHDIKLSLEVGAASAGGFGLFKGYLDYLGFNSSPESYIIRNFY